MEKIKKLAVDLPESLHVKIKANCALNNIAIKRWVINALLKEMAHEDKKLHTLQK